MTNKDFEAKKQEIINKLKAANDYIEFEDKLCATYRVNHASQMIRDLQPPKPPACSTCKHTVPIYNMFKSKILWRECKKVKLFKSSVGNATELPTRGWGCTRHSDYGDAE